MDTTLEDSSSSTVRLCKLSSCQKELVKREKEPSTIFVARVFCNRKCAMAQRSVEFREDILRNPKVCANPDCLKTFYRRLKSETKIKFAARQTCSVKCNSARRKQSNEGKKPRTRSEISTLPAYKPLAREIPDAPQPDTIEVWRPESWGGPIIRKVS